MDDAAYERTIRSLRAELDEAHETIRQLREGVQPEADFPDWVPYLTCQEERILLLLTDGRRWSRSKIMDVLYGHLHAIPGDKIVDIYIHRLRKKIRSVDLVIENDPGRGWRLSSDSIERLQAPHPSTSVSGGTAQPTSRSSAEVATDRGVRSQVS